jgi:diamine N-acetyltransferase
LLLTKTNEAILRDLTEADFATLRTLGETIWRQHYSAIISMAQIDYMLAGRYTPEKLQAYIGTQDRWLKLLVVDGEVVGYCSFANTENPIELKLEQLYLSAEFKGQGLGGFMLRHVEEHALSHGKSLLMLTVNKHNIDSIAIYRKSGFTVREEKVFDIGNGYVMDDFVMQKIL